MFYIGIPLGIPQVQQGAYYIAGIYVIYLLIAKGTNSETAEKKIKIEQLEILPYS